MIITISAPSGAGKSTLMAGILERVPNVHPLESVTTRTRRESDMTAGEYTFVSDAGFDELVVKDEFLWHVQVHKNRYGTRKLTIHTALADELYIPILTLDAVKTLHIYAILKKRQKSVRSLYLRINDEMELQRRLLRRGDQLEDIEQRIEDCRSWNEQAQFLGATMRFIDANQSKETVLSQALAHLKQFGVQVPLL